MLPGGAVRRDLPCIRDEVGQFVPDVPAILLLPVEAAG